MNSENQDIFKVCADLQLYAIQRSVKGLLKGTNLHFFCAGKFKYTDFALILSEWPYSLLEESLFIFSGAGKA